MGNMVMNPVSFKLVISSSGSLVLWLERFQNYEHSNSTDLRMLLRAKKWSVTSLLLMQLLNFTCQEGENSFTGISHYFCASELFTFYSCLDSDDLGLFILFWAFFIDWTPQSRQERKKQEGLEHDLMCIAILL